MSCGQETNNARKETPTANNSTEFQALGDQVGNGGKGIHCGDFVHLLDIYEAKVLHDLPVREEAWFGTLDDLLRRWQDIDPQLTIKIRKLYRQFDREVEFVAGPLYFTEDSYHIVDAPPNCQWVQLAIQRPPLYQGDAYYHIDQDLWKGLSQFGQVGLTLHELIYRHALSLGHSNSLATRVLVGFLLSGEVFRWEIATYQALMRQLGFARTP